MVCFALVRLVQGESVDYKEFIDLMAGNGAIVREINNNTIWKQKQYRLFTHDALDECLKGKRVVFLGDSTMTEVFNSIGLHLGHYDSDEGNLIKNVLFTINHARTPNFDIGFGYHRLHIKLNPNARNQTIIKPSISLSLQNRFIGHHDISDNKEGLKTFFHSSFRDELLCILGAPESLCRKPDIIVFNSIHHDIAANYTAAEYERYLHRVISLLQNVTSATDSAGPRNSPLLVWRDTLTSPKLRESSPLFGLFDKIARNVTSQKGVDYAETGLAYDIISKAVPELLHRMSADNFLHFGPISKFHFEMGNREGMIKKMGFPAGYEYQLMSMCTLATQILLNHMCPINAAVNKENHVSI